MNVVALDTHEVVKELKAAGFTDEQAEAVTRQLRHVQDVDLSTLATKTDLQVGLAAVRADLELGLGALKTDIQLGLAAAKSDLQVGLATVRADLEKSIAETKSEILKWMVGTIGLQTVVIVGAVLTLVRMMH